MNRSVLICAIALAVSGCATVKKSYDVMSWLFPPLGAGRLATGFFLNQPDHPVLGYPFRADICKGRKEGFYCQDGG